MTIPKFNYNPASVLFEEINKIREFSRARDYETQENILHLVETNIEWVVDFLKDNNHSGFIDQLILDKLTKSDHAANHAVDFSELTKDQILAFIKRSTRDREVVLNISYGIWIRLRDAFIASVKKINEIADAKRLSVELIVGDADDTDGLNQFLGLKRITSVDFKGSKDKDFDLSRFNSLNQHLSLVVPRISSAEIKNTLDSEYPYFSEITNRLCNQISTREIGEAKYFKLRPTLIAGKPGVGKTSYLKRFSELINVPARIYCVAGASDNLALKGLSRGWSTARPSMINEFISDSLCPNPLFVIDEIDKASLNRKNGSVFDVLISLCEPATASQFYDECLQVACDLSDVNFVFAANTLETIPNVLLDRLDILIANEPEPEHLLLIAQNLVKKFGKELGIDYRMLPNLDEIGLNEELIIKCAPRQLSKLVKTRIESSLSGTSSLPKMKH